MTDLRGLTLLRYGHVYDSGGGVEQYLTDLNGVLHARQEFTTIQLQLTSKPERVGEAVEGSLRRISLFVPQASHEQAIAGASDHAGLWRRLRHWGRDRILFAPWLYPVLTGPALARRRVPRRAGEPDGAGAAVRAVHQRFPLDLICLHSVGGADVAEILAVARAERIPTVYIHHFANDRLAGFAVRAQLDRLQGVAGVCGVEVPPFLRGRFHNVADGIDTEFFRRDRGGPRAGEIPIVFLPARITPTKGQAELIRAAGELRRRGREIRLVLAGRTDSPEYLTELKELARREGLDQRIEFVGQLGVAGLRDWYAQAASVAFPTRHHEGLPRILLECQAMEVPPVVYNIGGTASGIQDERTGFLVGLGDFSGLVNRLELLLRDDHRRIAMGRAGRRLVEAQFSLSSLAARHEAFYAQALSTARPAGRPSSR